MVALPRAPVLLFAAVLGCSSEAPFLSNDVSTRDISLAVFADGDAARTHVRVSLDGPRGDVRLLGEDRLLLRAGAIEVPLGRGDAGDLEAHLAPGTVGLSLHLARGAPETSVDVAIPMPPATTITVPATASRAAPLPIMWTGAGGSHTLTLALSGTCVPAITRPLSIDVGSYTLQPADLAGFSTETCAVTITLTRALVEQGSTPPLEHTYLSLTQVMTTVFASTP